MLRTKINFRKVFILVTLISMALSYLILLIKMLNSFDQRTDADFIAFYAAGRISQLYGTQNIYDMELQNRIEQNVLNKRLDLIQTNQFNHPPLLLPILNLLVDNNYVLSFVKWQIFLLIVYGISIPLLYKLILPASDLNLYLLLFVEALLFFPLYGSIANGQDTAVVFLGSVLLLIGFGKRWDNLAALGLALTALRPQITLVLVIPFIVNRRKVFAWFLVWIISLALVSLAITGPQGIIGFLNILLVSIKGEGYRLHEFDMVNIIGLLIRIAPGINTGIFRTIGWISYFSGIAFLFFWGIRNKKISEEQVAVSFILGLFASPHTQYHDLTLLLIPIVILMQILREKQSLEYSSVVLLPMVFSLLLLISCFSRAAKFNFPSLLMLVLVIWINFPDGVHRLGLKAYRIITKKRILKEPLAH